MFKEEIREGREGKEGKKGKEKTADGGEGNEVGYCSNVCSIATHVGN